VPARRGLADIVSTGDVNGRPGCVR
jgi:hypothetical protein